MSRARARLSLTSQVALLSLIPIVALGFVLARVLQAQIVQRTLADANQSAQLVARLGVQPWLTPRDLHEGLSAKSIHALDTQLRTRSVSDLARLKIWSAAGRIVYSDDHALIGHSLGAEDDDLHDALVGKPNPAAVVTPAPHTETASEVGLGQLVEVYVPLRFSVAGPPAGVFEIYLSYAPIAATVSHDERTIALVVFFGLALLWAILFRIVASASGRLRRQARENDRLARYDPLTGLPNRTLFRERVAEALSALAETGIRAAGACPPASAETGTDWGDTRSARIPKSASAAGACLPASVCTTGGCSPAPSRPRRTCWSAAMNSSASAKRAAGSLASARSTTASSSGGIAPRAGAGTGAPVETAPGGAGVAAALATALGASGMAETCLSAIVTAVSPSKGTVPVSNS
jgi:hypothetical protein